MIKVSELGSNSQQVQLMQERTMRHKASRELRGGDTVSRNKMELQMEKVRLLFYYGKACRTRVTLWL